MPPPWRCEHGLRRIPRLGISDYVSREGSFFGIPRLRAGTEPQLINPRLRISEIYWPGRERAADAYKGGIGVGGEKGDSRNGRRRENAHN